MKQRSSNFEARVVEKRDDLHCLTVESVLVSAESRGVTDAGEKGRRGREYLEDRGYLMLL